MVPAEYDTSRGSSGSEPWDGAFVGGVWLGDWVGVDIGFGCAVGLIFLRDFSGGVIGVWGGGIN